MPDKKQAHPADSLLSRYDERVAQGRIKDDAAQRGVLGLLEALNKALKPKKTGFFAKKKPVRGLYIWGNVGRGKSMLMDLFFENSPVKDKRRIHFHAFMQEVHARIHQLRQTGLGDPVMLLAKEIAQETSLLCFDELQATDPADASLLHRLFEGLFNGGVMVISTSNHPPKSLYTGGVQRERFDKFIALIEEYMDVAPLSSPADYRHMQMKSMQRVYFFPLGAEADAFLAHMLERLNVAKPKKDTLSVHGRNTPFTLYNEDIGRFSFAQLCETALGAADYLALAKRLDTLILTDIPRLTPEQRNAARRFVTLVDALYENKVKLIATAETAPEGIYTEGDGSFEFARTVSRLAEMQSESYLQA